MIKPNIFKKKEAGNPMIYNLQTAKDFLLNCKNKFILNLSEKIILTFFSGNDCIPCMVRRVEMINAFQSDISTVYGNAAIKSCYQYRKYINRYFK